MKWRDKRWRKETSYEENALYYELEQSSWLYYNEMHW